MAPRHPLGVVRLCVAEAFERFSYYTMAAVLVLFLAGSTAHGGFGWKDADAIAYYGTYVGLLWLMPLFGGWAADRWTGARRAVLGGALSISIGQLLMAGPALLPTLVGFFTGVPVERVLASAAVPLGELRPSAAVMAQLQQAAVLAYPANGTAAFEAARMAYTLSAIAFPLGLALLAIGVGFLKPNITVMLGNRYASDDPHRDRGFTLFYVAINVGGVLAGLVAGLVAERIGWSFGFLLAAVAMAIGFVILATSDALRDDAASVVAREPARPASDATPRLPRGPLLYVLAMTAAAVVFWGAYMQSGGVLNLFIYNRVDREIFGFVVPAAWLFVLTPAFVVLFGLGFQSVLDRYSARRGEIDTIWRFAGGLVLAAIAFLILTAASAAGAPTDLVAIIWPVLIYLILAIAELSLSPAGNAMAARYVPPSIAGRMMAIWFLCYAGGSVLSGYLGVLATRLGMPTMLAGTATLLLLTAAVLIVMRRPLNAWIGARGETPSGVAVQTPR